LIPFVRDYVRTLDVVDGRIELELPEGLVEACASTS
jgi:ribosomal 30S subunit maturation factor RimM